MTLKHYYLLILILCLNQVLTGELSGPIVHTKLGGIRGVRATDGDYNMYMGIPYAQVNRSNPFGASIPHQGFDGIFEANDDSAICPQNNMLLGIVGTLECLHLSVFVPNTANSTNLLSTMVFIYGGYFQSGLFGGPYYGRRFLMRHDIILVTFNYRLGPYGFLCLDIPEVPGNQGLKDQVTAFRWIHDNIEAFGGDPNKVTIFGHSSGATSAHLHLLYGKKNLYDKAIIASGTAYYPDLIKEPNNTMVLKIAERDGFKTKDVGDAIAYLASLDPKLVIEHESKLDIIYRPCIENKFENVTNFIWDYPINLNMSNKIPILVGDTGNEIYDMYLDKDTDLLYRTNDIFRNNLSKSFNFGNNLLSNFSKIVRDFYVADETKMQNLKDAMNEFSSDLIYNYPTKRLVNNYINHESDILLFLYTFTYSGSRNYMKNKLNITAPMSIHADELGYIFDLSFPFMNKTITPEDQHIINQFTTVLANFVKYGDPTPETSDLLPTKWKPVTKDKCYYMNIDTELSLRKRHYSKRMAFWDLFYELNKKYEKGYKNFDE